MQIIVLRTKNHLAESDFSFSARCAPKLFRKGNPEAERGRKMPFEGGFRRYLKKIRLAKRNQSVPDIRVRLTGRPLPSASISLLPDRKKVKTSLCLQQVKIPPSRECLIYFRLRAKGQIRNSRKGGIDRLTKR